MYVCYRVEGNVLIEGNLSTGDGGKELVLEKSDKMLEIDSLKAQLAESQRQLQELRRR